MVQVIGSGGQQVTAVGAPTKQVIAAAVRIIGVGGDGDDSLFLSAERAVFGPVTLDETDGVLGGTGTVTLPDIASQPATPQAFVLSAYMGDITVVPDPADAVIYTADNQTVAELVIPSDTAVILLRYVGVWRVISTSTSGGEGTGGLPIIVRLDSTDWLTFLGATVGGGTLNAAALPLFVGQDVWLDGDSFGADAGFYRCTSPGVFTKAAAVQYLDSFDYVAQQLVVMSDFGEAAANGGPPTSSTWVIRSPDGVTTIAAKASYGPSEEVVKRTVGTAVDIRADAATLDGSEHSVAATGSTLTLADAASFGHGQQVAISAVADDVVLATQGFDLLNGGAGLTIKQGSVAVLEAIDLTPFGVPLWNWNRVGGTGVQFDVPEWVGDGETGDVALQRSAGGTPQWTPLPAPPAPIDIGRVYNVRDYGAVGDGVTDDSDAFDAACAAAALLPGVILVPAVDREAGEAYVITRPIVLPAWTTLRGQGQASYITKPSTVGSVSTGTFDAGETLTFDLIDVTGFAAGQAVTISAGGNFEWNSTHAIIVEITGSVITIDRPTISAYTDPYIHTLFPLVANNPYHSNTPLATPTRGLRVEHLTLDQNAGIADPAGLDVDFTNSTIHWEHAIDAVVNDVHILDAAADGYSDQARVNDVLGVGNPTLNVIESSHIHDARRHGLHFGSSLSGAQAIGNRIENAGDMAAFLCAHAQDVLFHGNTIVNCYRGIAGADARLADDTNIVDGVTAPVDYRGDIATVVTGNRFIGGPANDDGGSGFAIELGPNGNATGNTITDWNGGILCVEWAIDCTITGNTITLCPSASRPGIRVLPSAHRPVITGNNVRGRGLNEYVLDMEDVDDAIVTGLVGSDCGYGVSLAGTINRARIGHLALTGINDPVAPIRIYGTTTDCSLDLTGIDVTENLGPVVLSYFAGAGEAAQTRLLLNGAGDNGSDNPATAGEWNAVSGQQFDGINVKWNDGDQHVSQYHDGDGWVELTSSGGGPGGFAHSFLLGGM